MNSNGKLRRQLIAGWTLLTGGVLLEALLLYLLIFEETQWQIVVGSSLPGIILLYFGSITIYSSSKGELLTTEEKAQSHRKAGHTSFWILLTAIMMDELFQFLPQNHLHMSLIYVGTFSVISTLIYHKYFSQYRIAHARERGERDI